MPLRKVAALLDIDVSILSKKERGERPLSKDVVTKLAKIYKHDEDELTVLYLNQKIVNEVGEVDLALRAIQVAEEQIKYLRQPSVNKELLLKNIRFFTKDGSVKKAWVLGSFATGNDMLNSDIDLMVTYSDNATRTLLDYADIKLKLNGITGKKIDLVEFGFIKPFALENIDKDKKLIYG